MQNNIKNKENFRPAFSYNFLTPLYDFLTETFGFGKALKRRVVGLLNINGNERVLDVGVGTGTLLIELRKTYLGLDLVGIDPDPKVLDLAQSKLNKYKINVKLVKAYAQELPFQNSSFDLVVSTLTFHHLPTEIKKKAIAEIYRTLRDKGKFLLADFGEPRSLPSSVLLHIGSIFDGGEEMRANLRGELPTLLKEGGFSVEKIGQRYLGVEFLMASK